MALKAIFCSLSVLITLSSLIMTVRADDMSGMNMSSDGVGILFTSKDYLLKHFLMIDDGSMSMSVRNIFTEL
jgi:hypothetical protein